MSELVPITKEDGWFTGKDKTFVFVARDVDGLPEAIDGWGLAWAAYRPGPEAGATAVVGPKTTASGEGITVVEVSVSSIASQLARRNIDTTGWPSEVEVAKVAVEDDDTANVPGQRLYHELTRTDPGLEDVLAHGPAELQQSATR